MAVALCLPDRGVIDTRADGQASVGACQRSSCHAANAHPGSQMLGGGRMSPLVQPASCWCRRSTSANQAGRPYTSCGGESQLVADIRAHHSRDERLSTLHALA